VQARNKDKLL